MGDEKECEPVGGSAYVAKTSDEIDEERHQQMAYQYLCHLEEAKKWIENCIGEELPPTTDLEESLRNGVILAKLASVFAPSVVKPSKIFDVEERKYHETGLHFRHTDNINYFLTAAKIVGLPEIFTPETTDVYDKKNMPRLIFCIHALSAFLYQKGIFRHQIQDLYGKVTFTQEEISAMKQALQAVGLPMLPQFRRIGGMLADEVPFDEAAMHAAIIAINDALDQSSEETVLNALQNPAAGLRDIDSVLYVKYTIVLRDAKQQKLIRNSEIISAGGDAYDEMLTREEIQSLITKMNLLAALEKVEECVKNGDLQNLQYALLSRHINLKSHVRSSKLEAYCRRLSSLLSQSADAFLKCEDIELAVSSINNERDEDVIELEIVSRINEIIKSGQGVDQLHQLLASPILGISESVLPFAVPLYLSELSYIFLNLQKDLTKNSIVKCVKFLEKASKINGAVRSGNANEFLELASLYLEDVDPKLCSIYMEEIQRLISRKDRPCWLLNHPELQDTIDQVNATHSSDLRCIEAIQNVNTAVTTENFKALHKAILSPDLKLSEHLQEDYFVSGEIFLTEDDAYHLLDLLIEIQQNKSLVENEDVSLWIEDILEGVRLCFSHCREAKSAMTALATLNMAILQKDASHTFMKMKHRDLVVGLPHLEEDLLGHYQERLYTLLKSRINYSSPWVWHRIRSGDLVFLNLQKHSYSWQEPKYYESNQSQYISSQDVKDIVEEVNSSVRGEEKLIRMLEPMIIRLQARCRGYLIRLKFFNMLGHYYDNEEKIVKVQALWRGILQRRIYQNQRKSFLRNRKPKTQLRDLTWYRRHEISIMKIQRFWRTHHYKKQFQQLVLSNDIKVPTLRKFLHLLDLQNEDFEQELELQSLKGKISQLIRHNQSLEKDLDEMDIKIGLLIKNRIDLEEVMNHNKLLMSRKSMHKDIAAQPFGELTPHHGVMQGAGSTATLPLGLKALKKESREKLDAYQHLFYQLQTCPEYLAKLIFAIPQTSRNKFLDTVILTLYNFGTNPREEFLLLKLFQTALEEEISNKVNQLTDIVSGNPLVIKMIVNYYRDKSSLVELLGPLVRSVLDDKNLHINLIPVEIYKQWINSLEFETGKACGYPYDVSTQEALKYPEVASRFKKSILQLKQYTTLFLATIVKAKSKNLLPYGLLHLSRVLYEALKKKFPTAAHKEVLKAVGNLIYYRYINSCIVAPDVFGIIDRASLDDGKGLNNDQRRNLGNIAKILQFAAAKKGFGEESNYLIQLNTYIIDCHEKFKKFFSECCSSDIPDPNEYFSIDQFTDAALIAKPIMSISLQELCDTHRLLLENIDLIAPDKNDKLRELLRDLGDFPSLLSLMGAASDAETASLAVLGKTEVCLTLTNKFSFETALDRASTDRLFVKTKQLLASVLPCTKESNLIGCLKSPTTEKQSELYWDLIEQKMAVEGKAEQNRTMLEHTNLFADDDERLPLDECKIQILKNLHILERHGYVSIKDGFHSILASLAKDICNQKEYRSRRRRDIFKLRHTIINLEAKSKFHEDQIGSYEVYIKQCLANLQLAGKSKKRVRFRATPEQKSYDAQEKTIRYTASRLHDKGILVSIDGLPQSQFKNVLFEFVSSGNGSFQIHAKFMGVNLEHIEIDIQDLLQKQYEGVTVMNMFGKAKINVNLLLHLLNTKFFGRKH